MQNNEKWLGLLCTCLGLKSCTPGGAWVAKLCSNTACGSKIMRQPAVFMHNVIAHENDTRKKKKYTARRGMKKMLQDSVHDFCRRMRRIFMHFVAWFYYLDVNSCTHRFISVKQAKSKFLLPRSEIYAWKRYQKVKKTYLKDQKKCKKKQEKCTNWHDLGFRV